MNITKLFNDNLNYWENKRWRNRDILNYIRQFMNKKFLILVIINKNGVRYVSNTHRERANIIKKFINDIRNKYPNLEVSFLLNLDDEIFDTDIEIHDLRENKNDNPMSHQFKWGVSLQSEDIIRIERSKLTKINFPIFTLNKNQDESIVFPHPNLLKNHFSTDNIKFKDKENKVPIYRFSNARANLFMPSRIKLVELSYQNPNIIDCKGGNKEVHKGHGDYVLRKGFIKLYKHLQIINNDINENEFLEYFHIKNYIEKEKLKDYKYLITNDSWYNLVDYALYNSVIFRYKLDKAKYYEDFILEDNNDIILFDEHNYREKYNYVINNEAKMEEMIESRKQKVANYLKYNKLVEHYGKLLIAYSKIQKINEIR